MRRCRTAAAGLSGDAMTAEFYRGRRVLVTGANGFIGEYLCSRLESLGAHVVGVCRSEHGDLSEPGVAERILDAARPDIVFHMASLALGGQALDLVLPILTANLVAAVRLMTAAAERRTFRVVLAGSIMEPEAEEAPSSPYSAAKGAQVTYARMFHNLYALDVVVARMSVVYGPDWRNDARLLPYVTRTLLRGEPARLTSGQRRIDWVYVDDVVDALLILGSTEGLGGLRIDIGSGRLASVRAVAEEVVRLTGSTGELVFGAVPDRHDEPLRIADVEETYRRIGWRAAVTLEEGIRRTVAWYLESERKAE